QKKRPKTIHVHLVAVVQQENGRCLMRERDGLWEFPMFNEIPSGSLVKTGTCRHTITHHRLDVSVFVGTLERMDGFEWREIQTVPISSLTRKILEHATGTRRTPQSA